MKRILLACLLFINAVTYSQTTYYWVGSAPAANGSISTNSNWNTLLNGTGAPRPAAIGASDILVFDGTNLGGATVVTGPVTVVANGITCGQMKFVNNADVSMLRTAVGGTSTIIISGGAGEDLVVETGSVLSFTNGTGSVRVTMAAANTGRVSGTLRMITGQQMRIENTTTGTGSLIFTSGSSFVSNITGASSYAFGSVAQSSEKWVIFESGSHLYYEGGNSPMASSAFYSPIDFKPGSIWHHRLNNGPGTFFNRKSFADIIVENNATLTVDGPIYRIDNLSISAGSSMVTNATGQTAVLGNIVVDGTFSSPAASTHELLMAGNTPQTISGSGSINIAGLLIASNAVVTLNINIGVDNATNVYGKLNFNTNRLTGNGAFTANAASGPVVATGNITAGLYLIPGTGISASQKGMGISGAGIAPNTAIVGFSSTGDSLYLSAPLTATGTGVALTLASNEATLQTANTNGFDPATGSVGSTGPQSFINGINYIINGATTWPFGVSTSTAATPITAKFIEINAPVSVNRAFTVSDHLAVNGKITLRPLDIIHILPGGIINGTINASNYIATVSNSVTGEVSALQYDGIASSVVLPVGTANYYLPVTINPASASIFSVNVFEGITSNGIINGTPLTLSEKQNVVNAVWNINRLSGAGSSDIQLGWHAALEGSTFTTLPNTDIGLIANTGSSWALPVGTASNTTNTVTATINSFGSFSVGAVPQVQPFVFNPIPVKAYGDADFNGGATSLNTTQPTIYSSDNLAVATIVGGNIHITGAGTATITATQATDGFYPAASTTQSLTVSKAALTITADNKLKFQGQANPALTVTYTGFVLGETATVLLTQAVITTTAVTSSPAGAYPITVNGATAANYTITFVDGVLTVQPQQSQTITFNAFVTKTYGNADFSTGATSTNATIPITYASSNPLVATIIGNGVVHITGGRHYHDHCIAGG